MARSPSRRASSSTRRDSSSASGALWSTAVRHMTSRLRDFSSVGVPLLLGQLADERQHLPLVAGRLPEAGVLAGGAGRLLPERHRLRGPAGRPEVEGGDLGLQAAIARSTPASRRRRRGSAPGRPAARIGTTPRGRARGGTAAPPALEVGSMMACSISRRRSASRTASSRSVAAANSWRSKVRPITDAAWATRLASPRRSRRAVITSESVVGSAPREAAPPSDSPRASSSRKSGTPSARSTSASRTSGLSSAASGRPSSSSRASSALRRSSVSWASGLTLGSSAISGARSMSTRTGAPVRAISCAASIVLGSAQCASSTTRSSGPDPAARSRTQAAASCGVAGTWPMTSPNGCSGLSEPRRLQTMVHTGWPRCCEQRAELQEKA